MTYKIHTQYEHTKNHEAGEPRRNQETAEPQDHQAEAKNTLKFQQKSKLPSDLQNQTGQNLEQRGNPEIGQNPLHHSNTEAQQTTWIINQEHPK